MVFETTLTLKRSDELHAAGLWRGERLFDSLKRRALADPDAVALVDSRGRLRYGELVVEVERAAWALLGLGVRRGDVVVLQLPNWNEFVVAMLAIERIGAVVNPVAPIFRERELRMMCRLGRPVGAIVAAEFRGWDHPKMFAQLSEEGVGPAWVAAVPGTTPKGTGPPLRPEDLGALGTLDWNALLAAELPGGRDSQLLDCLTPDPDDVAELIFTSGTTGEPKGVLHTHNTLRAAADVMIEAQDFHAGDVFHMASTFAHQTGYLFGARVCLQVGGRGVFQDTWEPRRFLELVESERVTVSCGATPFLADALGCATDAGRDLSSLRCFGCFGAPIPTPILERARAELPCRVMPGWGMTEVGLLTTTRPADPEAKIAGSDGAAAPGTAVRVVDERGGDVPAGVEGHLQCKGHTAFVGYIQGRELSESCFSEDGWFETGDRAAMDGDGFIRITAREKDIIIRGGENVPVKEIEDLVMRHPAVLQVALVGLPDERLGEIGRIFVVLEAGAKLDFAGLRDYLGSEQLTRQFWPERFEILEEMPMTPSGKVQKFKLREWPLSDRA